MNTRTIFAALTALASLTRLAYCDDVTASLRAADGLFEQQNKKTLRLESLPSKRVIVYLANRKT